MNYNRDCIKIVVSLPISTYSTRTQFYEYNSIAHFTICTNSGGIFYKNLYNDRTIRLQTKNITSNVSMVSSWIRKGWIIYRRWGSNYFTCPG